MRPRPFRQSLLAASLVGRRVPSAAWGARRRLWRIPGAHPCKSATAPVALTAARVRAWTVAPTIEELEGLSDEELRARYNEIAEHTVVGLEWYREELQRRQFARQTRWLVILTVVIAILTATNVVLVAVDVSQT
jgi:hypothetical protein